MQLSPTEREAVAEEIRDAKFVALQIAKTAAERRGEPWLFHHVPNAKLETIVEAATDAYQRSATLAALGPSPFFCRITAQTQVDRNSKIEEFLFVKARLPGVGFIDGSDAMMLSWTSPLYSSLRASRPGESVRMGKQPGAAHHRVLTSSDWDKVLPYAEGILLRRPDRDIVLDHESSIDRADSIAESQPEHSQSDQVDDDMAAKPRGYGLGEIIALADASQRSAMHLPFEEDVLIEGPPGSGKTSVGLMRIPCLLDRQWEELGLRPGRDLGFHSEQSTRVLVMNEEMVPYLDRLMREIDIKQVPVDTLGGFCRDICKLSGMQTLTGVPRTCSDELETAKFSSAGLRSFASAIQASVREYWNEVRDDADRKFSGVHSTLGKEAHRVLSSWVEHVAQWQPDNFEIAPELRVCQRLNNWAMRRLTDNAPSEFEAAGSPENTRRTSARDAIRRIMAMSTTVVKNVFDRKRITERLETTFGLTDPMISEWRAQCQRTDQSPATCSEADYALHGWITAIFLLSAVPESERVLIGGRRPRLTHVAIDEAQDISKVHVLLLRSLIDERGTLTLVGDLRQRLGEKSHFSHWRDLPLREPCHASFAVNHRQSREIGEFVRAEHLRLFGEPATWQPSKRPGPMVREVECQRKELTHRLSQEILQLVRAHPDFHFGVLFVGNDGESAMSHLRDEVEHALQDELVAVEIALPNSSERQLRRESGVTLAPVAMTKGLEFDGVVLISPESLGTQVMKNRHYVGCSRARVALSVVRVTD